MTDSPLDLDAILARDLKPGDVLMWTGKPRTRVKDRTKVIARRKDDDSGWWMTDGSGLADYVWDDGTLWMTPARLLALVDAKQAEVERLRAEVEAAREAHDRAVTRGIAHVDRAERAEAQVAAMLALHTPTRVWLRSTPEPSTACSICQDPWPCITAAAVDAPADVPMSPNTGHDLRERIAQRIDQAWAEANDRRPRSEYRDGYLDGLEHAEAAARSTPLTMGGAS